LHSCALAASQMGGSLRAESDGPGKGAKFTLELPMKAAQETAMQEAAMQDDAMQDDAMQDAAMQDMKESVS